MRYLVLLVWLLICAPVWAAIEVDSPMESQVGFFMLDSADIGADCTGTGKAITNTCTVTTDFETLAMIIWTVGSTSSTDNVAAGDARPGIGFGSSITERYALCGIDTDASATTAAATYHNKAAVLCTTQDGGTVEGLLDWTATTSTTVEFTVDDAFTDSIRVGYLFLGGTGLVSDENGTFLAATGSPPFTQAVSTGFQPEALLMASGIFTSDAPGGGDHMRMSIGAATGASTGDEGHASIIAEDGFADTANHFSYSFNDEVTSRFHPTNNTIIRRAEFVSFDATPSFTLNWLEVSGSTTVYQGYMAFAGGDYEAGQMTSKTAGPDFSEENIGFEPSAVFFVSHLEALSTQDTPSTVAQFSIGAFSATDEREVQAMIGLQDGSDDPQVAIAVAADGVYLNIDSSATPAIEGQIDISSISSTGFTLTQAADYDPSANYLFYIAFGPRTGVPPGVLGNLPTYMEGATFQ